MNKRFYALLYHEDGSVDVYLMPDAQEAPIYIVRGVIPWEDMEQDIRRRFYDWCASGERIK